MKLYFNGNDCVFRAANLPDSLNEIRPSQKSKVRESFRTLSMKFGDGYSQEAPDGLNPSRITGDMIFENRRAEVVQALIDFFRGTGSGTLYDRTPDEYFWWLPPEPYHKKGFIKILVRNVDVTWSSANIATVTCTFEQTFQV